MNHLGGRDPVSSATEEVRCKNLYTLKLVDDGRKRFVSLRKRPKNIDGGKAGDLE